MLETFPGLGVGSKNPSDDVSAPADINIGPHT